MAAPHFPELLAPAGNMECARAAVANGADAVYFGLPRFNARLRADNFCREELLELVRFLRAHGVRSYATLNVLIFPEELDDAVGELVYLRDCGVDGVLVQDVGLAAVAARLVPGLDLHASTQMTITSPEGTAFAARLGAKRVVLGREVSLRELAKFSADVPLEVFVHGALCVAYSGQCLTSEALGKRSANRGECAQACRMPYGLVVDGELRDLGDRRYLLSPADLAAVREIPALLEAGVSSFKIEGRLKEPEYVAAVTAVYRKAIDAALRGAGKTSPSPEDWFRLEMTFSRGLYSGWLHGVNHQELVGARFGKKRGPLAGRVAEKGRDWALVDGELPLAPGDGIVFDTGGDTENEQGGRIYEVREGRLFFAKNHIDFSRVPTGCRVWKTDDPRLRSELRKTWAGRIPPRPESKIPLDIEIHGAPGEQMRLVGKAGEARAEVVSRSSLQPAEKHPLDEARLHSALEHLEETPFFLRHLEFRADRHCFLPASDLNHLRRALADALQAPRTFPVVKESLREILEGIRGLRSGGTEAPSMSVLCRDMGHVEAAIAEGADEILLDFEEPRRYAEAVRQIRKACGIPVFLATPRIQKAGEAGFYNWILRAEPDGVLLRNVGATDFFASSNLKKLGDFSLNVANPLAADLFLRMGLARVTVSYDLDAMQVVALAQALPPGCLELTLHQHLPMFHMEHCVFAAFLSEGKDFRDCGRPCDRHRIRLRDRIGMEHPMRADVGCRNTVFHAVAQSGAADFKRFVAAGIFHHRVELLEETSDAARQTVAAYRELLDGRTTGDEIWRRLKARSQLGVTRGTLQPSPSPGV